MGLKVGDAVIVTGEKAKRLIETRRKISHHILSYFKEYFVVEAINPSFNYPIALEGLVGNFKENELTKYSIEEEEILWD